ncbi:hypothetical protein LKMONMHP_0159 [Methylobacterium organophilum]|uniref:Outer membrane beta-barrel protein n=1 Tax=Methylobacterium organophilum TaxID=410 RepID=A0ABQ4T489_METOR|nr:hypothetical protein LKMONMHP_0159 [Methylobacterium organophilum]
MKRPRPIAETARTARAPARTVAVALALAAGLLVGPALAQEAPDAAGADLFSPKRQNRLFAQPGADDLPSLRGVNPSAGSAGGGEAGVGVSGGGEGLSRLPRFRSGGSAISSVANAPNAARPSLLRLRAAPPRRIGLPTRQLTRGRIQDFTTDLRLTPVIQPAVSGVPLPTPIPVLGLLNPTGILLGTALRRPIAADQAYAPLGIKLGTFTVLPAFTQSIGYDSNPDQIGGNLAKPSLVLRSEGEVVFRSDWSSSALEGELRGGYLEYPDNEASSRPNAAGTTRLRVDMNRDTRIDVETRFLLDTLRLGSPEVGSQATSRPIYATYGGTVGVTENFNRLQVTLRGSIDRQIFEDARLASGAPLIQSDRDTNQYGLRLRIGYEVSPAITPFVETIVDTRVYDTPVDQQGFRRDSDGVALTGGASFALTRFITGEVSGGLQRRDYVDARLRAISSPLINAALIWSVSPLTTVRFNQQTGVIETSVAGASGVATNVATLEVQHDLLRNLSITLGGAYIANDYQGVSIRERGFSATARLDYRFNRWLTLRGSYIHQELTSTAAASSYQADTVLLGVRVNP